MAWVHVFLHWCNSTNIMLVNVINYKSSNNHKGVVAIEFALVMTFILVPLFLGTVEVGRLLYQYNSLAKSVRDSTKYLSTVASTVPNYANYVTEAKCLAVYGNIGCNGSPIATDLTTADIKIDPPQTVSGIKVIKVSVSGYDAKLITTFFQSINFNNISVSMRQQEA